MLKSFAVLAVYGGDVPIEDVEAGDLRAGDVVRVDDRQAHRVERVVCVGARVVVEMRPVGLEISEAVRVTLPMDRLGHAARRGRGLSRECRAVGTLSRVSPGPAGRCRFNALAQQIAAHAAGTGSHPPSLAIQSRLTQPAPDTSAVAPVAPCIP